jgi:hypothetical protein
MSKKTIWILGIILGLVIIAGIITCYFFFYNSIPSPKVSDIKNNEINTTNNKIDYENSPFGVFTAFSYFEFTYFNQKMGFDVSAYMNWADEHMKDLGAHWTRSNLQLMWDKIEPVIGKGYNWNNEMGTDEIIKKIYASSGDINWLGVFHEQSGSKQGALPNGQAGRPLLRNPLDYPNEYKAFVKAVVERYDGDGIDDVSPNVKVKYWQAGNEVMGWTGSGRNAPDYVDYVKLVSGAVKEADPEAKIVLIAPADGEVTSFMKEVIQDLAKEKAFDVIDIHSWDKASNWKMNTVKEYRSLLDSLGLNYVQIWSCENGTWVGQPKGSPTIQTESDQALFLVKKYVYNLANGLDKLMWNNLMEWNNFNGSKDSMFNSMGLIGDGVGQGEDAATFNVPRLSYYSYKLMTQKLEGSNWKGIEKLIEDEDTYLYKFTNKNTGKEVFVAWHEGDGTTDLSFEFKGTSALVTEAIPKYDSGKSVTDYNSAFNKGGATVVNGKAMLKLGSVPVYIEESNENLSTYQPTIIPKTQGSINQSLQDNQLNQTVKGRCGDGVCGPIEKANPALCPQDCK